MKSFQKLRLDQQSTKTVVDENKVTTIRYNASANYSKKFIWKNRQQEYHFQKAQQTVAKAVEKNTSNASTTMSKLKVNVAANSFQQLNIVVSRNDQQKYAVTDQSNALHRKMSNKVLIESKSFEVTTNATPKTTRKAASFGDPSKNYINKSTAKSNTCHDATSNKKLINEVAAKTSKIGSKKTLSKDTSQGSKELKTKLGLDKSSAPNQKPTVPQQIKRQRHLHYKLNIQKLQKQFLSNYNALFMKRHLKVGHNSRKRILHVPEISYIFEDKMCWFKPRRFQPPRRLLKYRNAETLDDLNPRSKSTLQRQPNNNLELHIFGFPKSLQRFNDCFKRLCEIISVDDMNMNIQNVRNKNGAKVVQLNDSNQRNQFLAAYEDYDRLVKAGMVLPITSKLCGGGGSSKQKICVRPDPKKIKKRDDTKRSVGDGIQISISAEDWASVLYRQRPILVSGTESRAYGAIINASKILCHAF